MSHAKPSSKKIAAELIISPRSKGSLPSRDMQSQSASVSNTCAADDLHQLAVLIVAEHNKLEFMLVSSALKMAEVGNMFLRAKSLLGHGKYEAWIADEITARGGISKRTVQRYTSIAKNWAKIVSALTEKDLHSDSASELDVQQLLKALSMTDALELLRVRSMGYRSKHGARKPIQWNDISHEFGESYYVLPTGTLAHFLEPNSADAITQLIALAGAGSPHLSGDSVYLVLPDGSFSESVAQVHVYCHACIRNEPMNGSSIPSKTSSFCQMVVATMPGNSSEHCRASQALGSISVFLPIPSHGDSNQ